MTAWKVKKIADDKHDYDVLERVNVVCVGQIKTDLYGHRGFLLLIDQGSRYRWVYTLKQKGEVPTLIKNWVKYIERQSGTLVKRVHSDNGTELKNDDLSKWSKRKCVKWTFSGGYRPQENGLAECSNRSVIQVAPSLLISSRIPRGFWCYAVVTSVYLLNRTLTRTLKWRSPFGELWNRKPKYHHLRVF